jgi:hypothetical protein
MRDGLARARKLGWDRVLLVGDAPYYSRFGFARLDDVVMPPPTNPARVLGLELRPRAWVDVTGPVTREPLPAADGIARAASALPACVTVDHPKEDSDANQSATGASADQ